MVDKLIHLVLHDRFDKVQDVLDSRYLHSNHKIHDQNQDKMEDVFLLYLMLMKQFVFVALNKIDEISRTKKNDPFIYLFI